MEAVPATESPQGIASVAGSQQDPSTTNGWDAVFAMNLEQVNALLYQEFLDIGPVNTRAETFLRCALSDDDSSMWILDATLGPPAVKAQAASPTATVEMELLKGAFVTLDFNTLELVSAALIRPDESTLTGSLDLTKVQGEVNSVGAVVMDLGASAYTPSVKGIDPGSVLNTKIGEAARTYFRDNDASYTLGIISNDKVAASLTPTSFSITTQQHPNKSDNCVLVLIKTDGQEGTVAPLPTYPIPDGAKVALLIADRAFFGALGDDLDQTFAQFGTKFSRQQAGPASSTVGAGGVLGSGPFGKQYDWNEWNEYFRAGEPPWTSDAHGNLAAVQMPLGGFSITASSGQLAATWSKQFPQDVTGLNNSGGIVAVVTAPSTLQVDYSCSGGEPTVDAGSSKVSFKFTDPTVSLKVVEEPSGWYAFWSGARGYNDQLVTDTKAALLQTLQDFKVATIDAFRLKSILFPSPHTVRLTAGSLSGGMRLTGEAEMPIAVTPGSKTIQPGGTVQFSAAAPDGAKVMWQCLPPGVGSIDRDAGLYKAPAAISSAQVVVVTATDTKATTVYGSAMVLVAESPAAQGVAVGPSKSLVAPGRSVLLSATDTAGNPITANCTLTPALGSIKPGRKQGEYLYVAPAQATDPTDVTVTVVDASNPAHTGTATIRVMPPSTIAVQPGPASVKLGAQLALTAKVGADADASELRWVVYPAASGKVVADHDDPTKATYTAPTQTPSGGNVVTVVAYLVDEDTAGSGSTTITLTS